MAEVWVFTGVQGLWEYYQDCAERANCNLGTLNVLRRRKLGVGQKGKGLEANDKGGRGGLSDLVSLEVFVWI
jgi:hypothetical protein